MQRMKIIHVLDHFDVGGLQNGVVNVINGLDPDRFEHRVCTITRLGQSPQRVRHPDVHYYDMQKPPAHDPWMPLRLAHIFRRERPHIVHTRNWGAMDGIFAAKLAGVPALIHSEHGRDQFNMRSESRKRVWLRRVMFRLADCVFTVSDELRIFFHQLTGFSLQRIRMIPNGVDLARFAEPTADRWLVRQALGVDLDAFLVGAVGRLDPVKDQMTLLRAIKLSLDQKAPVHALIAGDGPLRSALADYVRTAGLGAYVHLLGHRADLVDLLAALDVFVLPSLSEGMSNTILEAMAAGKAVVATRVGGNPQLIEGGKSGLLFPAGDVEALASHLGRLYSQPQERQALGEEARRRAGAEFSLSRMIERYSDLYTSIVKEKGCEAAARDSKFVAT